jgi:hypothetical protein
MPQARKFNELEVEGTSVAIDGVPRIEQEIRPLMPNRDIVLPAPTAEDKSTSKSLMEFI